MQVLNISNPRYLESGAIDCEVLFDVMAQPVTYTATPDDVEETGRLIWASLQEGKWGHITPFSASIELITQARKEKKREIDAWRTEQEQASYVIECDGRQWDAGPVTMLRLSPFTIYNDDKSELTVVWGDAENNQIALSYERLKLLTAAMANAQIERNTRIYQRQREMKDKLETLASLAEIRSFVVGWED